MSSRIEHRAEFPRPLDEVLAALAGEDSLRDRLEKIGGHDAALLEYTKSEGEIAYTMRQGIPADKLPGVVRSLHSGDLMVQREQNWRQASDRAASGSATASVSGVPGAITARSELTESGGKTTLVITGEAKVSIPLVGGKIERSIAENVTRLLDHESEFIAKQLTDDGKDS
ncbi:MAG: DUF2505 family protein [Actinophytocola sp.]|nr:DUF2505 family protein [Actinophytocola sp.]